MDKVIEKIKKLLRLSKDSGASAHEAAQALKMALKLATKHGIDLQAISTDDDTGTATTHHTAKAQAHGDAEKYASYLVQAFFHTTPLFQTSDGKKSVTFIGGKVQTEISTYAFTYIVSSMRKAWKNNNDRRLKRAGFLRGYFNALYSEIPRVFRSNDLVVCHDNYIEETFYSNPLVKRGTVSETSTKGGSASAQAGYRAGKKQGIRNGLEMN